MSHPPTLHDSRRKAARYTSAMSKITAVQRRALRAKAHHLAPVVSIGQHGLTPSVQHEIDLALLAHELIKVKVASNDREARGTMLDAVCAALSCAPVQHLGKVFILWRSNPEKKPKAGKRPATDKPASDRAARRTSAKTPAGATGSVSARSDNRAEARTAKPVSREKRGAAVEGDDIRSASRRRLAGSSAGASKERKSAAGSQGLPYFSRRGAGRFVAATPAATAKPVARRRGRGG
jgi:RNA-binding protein